jgi:hypothetical protein
MTILANYARHSFKQTTQVESLLRDVEENAMSNEERLWKFSLARQIIKELNECGSKEIPSQAFGGE